MLSEERRTELMEKYLEDYLQEEEAREFADWLEAASPEAREAAQSMLFERMLAQYGAVLMDADRIMRALPLANRRRNMSSDVLRKIKPDEPGSGPSTSSGRTRTGISARARTGSQRSPAVSSNPFTQKRWAMASAAAVLVLIVGFLYMRAQRAVEPTNALAVTLVESRDAQWDGVAPKPGDTLGEKTVALKAGVARFAYPSGVNVILEGPATLEFVAKDRARLKEGKVVARVPKGAEGFAILAGKMAAVDLGTEFGVTYADRKAEVHVFEGHVALRQVSDLTPTNTVKPTPGETVLAAGQAGRENGTRIETFASAPERFSREIVVRRANMPFLHPLFSDHVVLQRNMDLPIWGWTRPGERVTVGLAGKTQSVTAGPDGQWLVKFPAFAAGGPHEIEISGPQLARVRDVMIGDVWLLAGQSGMAATVDSLPPAERSALNSNSSLIRVLRIGGSGAPSPQELFDPASNWKVVDAQTVSQISAIGLAFANKLKPTPTLAVGVIDVSAPGMRTEQLISREGQTSLEEYQAALSKVKPRVLDSFAYNQKSAPIIRSAFTGVVLYAGEEDATETTANYYEPLLKALFRDWRWHAGRAEIPFVLAQLPGSGAPKQNSLLDSRWALIREAQAEAARKVPNTTLTVLIDLCENNALCPDAKRQMGERLALGALEKVYNNGTSRMGPRFRKAVNEEGRIRVTFDDSNGLHGDREMPDPSQLKHDIKGFAIAGPDKKFVEAVAVIYNDMVMVSSPEVTKPVAVRYGWADNPECNLYNKFGQPAAPFRTDNW